MTLLSQQQERSLQWRRTRSHSSGQLSQPLVVLSKKVSLRSRQQVRWWKEKVWSPQLSKVTKGKWLSRLRHRLCQWMTRSLFSWSAVIAREAGADSSTVSAWSRASSVSAVSVSAQTAWMTIQRRLSPPGIFNYRPSPKLSVRAAIVTGTTAKRTIASAISRVWCVNLPCATACPAITTKERLLSQFLKKNSPESSCSYSNRAALSSLKSEQIWVATTEKFWIGLTVISSCKRVDFHYAKADFN